MVKVLIDRSIQIPSSVEEIHDEAVSDLGTFLGVNYEKHPLFALIGPDPMENTSGHSIMGTIQEDPAEVYLSKELIHLHLFHPLFRPTLPSLFPEHVRMSRAQGVKVSYRSLIRDTLTHEEAHLVFSDRYSNAVEALVSEREMKSFSPYSSLDEVVFQQETREGSSVQGSSFDVTDIMEKGVTSALNTVEENTSRIVLGINEAFANWITDRINGVQMLTQEKVEWYEDDADGEAFSYFYTLFHSLSDHAGDALVLDNFENIVREGLEEMEYVALPSNKGVSEVFAKYEELSSTHHSGRRELMEKAGRYARRHEASGLERALLGFSGRIPFAENAIYPTDETPYLLGDICNPLAEHDNGGYGTAEAYLTELSVEGNGDFYLDFYRGVDAKPNNPLADLSGGTSNEQSLPYTTQNDDPFDALSGDNERFSFEYNPTLGGYPQPTPDIDPCETTMPCPDLNVHRPRRSLLLTLATLAAATLLSLTPYDPIALKEDEGFPVSNVKLYGPLKKK